MIIQYGTTNGYLESKSLRYTRRRPRYTSSKIPPREKNNDGNRVRGTLHHFPLKFSIKLPKTISVIYNRKSLFRHKKHVGILDPNEPKKHISIEMPQKMDERDFQNVVYPCCGLVEFKKWGVQHNRCYGGGTRSGYY